MAKILIIEDDPVAQKLLRLCLEEQKHLFSCVSSGPEAMDLLRTKVFDLIIVDWSLPGMSGIEICTELRRKKNSTRILMITAKTDPEDIVEGLDSGADDYVTKPFEPRILTAKIRALASTWCSCRRRKNCNWKN